MKKWLTARVEFESSDPETTGALITGVFQDLGLQGVVLETPGTDPDLDWAEDALPVEDDYAVIGFFPEHLQDQTHLQQFEGQIRRLHSADSWKYKIEYSEINEEDWAESWKAHFHPIKVTERIVIKPTWQPYETDGNEMIIEIDPGMAFGTGTHPTTSLCIRLVERHLVQDMRFLDIGTGSGILMITAARLGADRLIGIDNDPVAIEVAEANMVLNRVDPDRYDLFTGHLAEQIEGPFGMITANILAEIVCKLIPAIPSLLAENGLFIASGIIVEKESMVTRTLLEHGMEIVETEILDGWVAIVAKFTTPRS